MTDFSLSAWFGLLFRKKPQATDPRSARRGYEFARHVYNETGGPTPELKRLHREFVEKQKRTARSSARGSRPLARGRECAVAHVGH